jgi:DNA-binding NarL/FixJ family response regulator
MEQIRILIAEDERVLLEALRDRLSDEPDIEVVAACLNGRDGLIDAMAHRPHVVLTDLRMPRMDGIEFTRQIREKLPDTAVVVLTAFDDDEDLFAAIKAGAVGYVLKDASPAQIVQALHAARVGEGFLSAGLTARVMKEFGRIDTLIRGQKQLFTQLTRRETEVLELLALYADQYAHASPVSVPVSAAADSRGLEGDSANNNASSTTTDGDSDGVSMETVLPPVQEPHPSSQFNFSLCFC